MKLLAIVKSPAGQPDRPACSLVSIQLSSSSVESCVSEYEDGIFHTQISVPVIRSFSFYNKISSPMWPFYKQYMDSLGLVGLGNTQFCSENWNWILKWTRTRTWESPSININHIPQIFQKKILSRKLFCPPTHPVMPSVLLFGSFSA